MFIFNIINQIIDGMYLVINASPDGDEYFFSASERKARAHYIDSSEYSSEESPVYLAKIKDGVEFGFGARGNFFGGELLETSPEIVIK
jgi:hypothetical protein